MSTVNVETEEHLLTVEELAAFLRVPQSWVYSRTRVATEIGFPLLRAGKYLRFRKDEVLHWLTTKTAE